MDGPSVKDLVLVHLLDAQSADCRTTVGICDALDVDVSVSDRVAVLSALSTLRESGYLEKQASSGADRTTYTLTETGREAASERRAALCADGIVVEDGNSSETYSAATARDALDLPSVATVLQRATDGRIRIDDVPDDHFVGREAELDRIETALDAVADGAAGVGTIVGERGVGKTELLRRITTLAADRDATVLSITCRVDPSDPFEPLRDALVAHGLTGVFDRPSVGLDGAGNLLSRQVELFGDIVAAIDSLDRPLLVVVDDLHEAGEAVREFIEFFTERLPERTLVLAASRPGDPATGTDPTAPIVDGGDLSVAIDLSPLDRERTRELLVRQFGDADVPVALTDRLYDRTAGTPLFVTETAARLVETGVVDPDAGIYPDPTTSFPIPENVSEAVAVRLDALDETARSVLEDAAILGQTIDPDVLNAISDRSREDLRTYLDLFVETGLFDENPLRFRSEVTREVVLGGIDPSRKRRRHAAVAAAYEEEVEDPPHAAIARHHERAGRPGEALVHYRAAGERALEVYAHEESLDHYERALSIARDLDRDDIVVEIVESIGHVHYVTGEYDDAHRYFEYLRETTDDPELIQRSYRYQSEMASERGDLDAAERYATAGIEAVEEPNRVTCRLIGHRGWYELQRGNLEAAEEWFHRQHDLAADLDDEDRLAGAHHNLGTLAHYRGELDEAIEYLERAATENDRSGSSRDAMASYNNLSIAYRDAGRIDDAIDALETVRDRAVAVGDRPTELLAVGNLVGFYRLRGDLDRAERTAQEAIDDARTLGLSGQEATALSNHAVIRLIRCEIGAAVEGLERALTLHQDGENARMVAGVHDWLAWVALLRDDPATARDHVEAGLDASDGAEPEVTARVLARLGDVERAEGDYEAAIDAYERALDAVDRAGSLQTSALVNLRLAVAESESTDGEGGLERATTAVEEASGIDAPLLLARALTARARCRRIAGDYEAAATDLDDADTALEGIDAPLYESRRQVEAALLADDRGDDDATDLLQRAHDVATDNGVAALAARCRLVRSTTPASE